MRMRTRIPAVLAAVLASALVAACGDEPPQPRVSANPPQPTTGAAAGSTTSPEKLPAPQGTKQSEAKPDAGDANDHSSPQHDARNKKNGD